MALRRRAKKLTTMMTSVDRRLRAVEFNSAPSGISIAQVSNVVSNAISQIPPNTYGNVPINSPDSPIGLHNIDSVTYYSPNSYIKGKAADTAWIVVHTATDHGFTTDDIGKKKVTVSGLGVFNGNLELAPSWGAPNARTLRLITPFKIYTQYGATQVYTYPITDAIVQKSYTFTDATLYFGGLYNMGLVKGDVINISEMGAPFDGTFVITDTGVSTANGNKKYIKYKFLTKQSAQNTTAVTATGAISPVLHKYAAIGDTWIDTSQTPPVTYYWNGAGWTSNLADIPAGTIIKDGVAPAAVTNLAATSEGYTDPKTYASVSRVHLTWEAPTLNGDNSPLTNLAGYKIERKDLNTGLWIQVDDRVDNDTDAIIDGLRRETEHEFGVTPYDSAKEFGPRSTVTIITGAAASALTGLSAPTLVTKLGTVAVTWDGKDENGAIPAPGLARIEVHASKTAAFSPSDATFQGNMTSSTGDKLVIAGLDYATYYFKFVAVDTTGNKFASTLESHILIKSLVNADVIANTLTTWPFAGQVVNINAIANGSINVQHLLPNAVTQNAIAANAIGADQIIAGQVVAGKLGVGAVVANSISALAVSANAIAANAIVADKINAGAITAVKISSGAVSADKIAVNDTFSYSNNAVPYTLRIGMDAIAWPADRLKTVGMSFNYNSSVYAWVSSYSGSTMSVGTQMTTGEMIFGISGANTLSASFSGGINLSASTAEILLVGKTTIFSNFVVGNTSQDIDRVFLVNNVAASTNNRRVTVLNPNTATTNNSFDVYGSIRYSGTLGALSARRFKTDLRAIDPDYRLLDIDAIRYKYDYAAMAADHDDSTLIATGLSPDYIGVIAEDFSNLGYNELMSYNDKGQISGIDYSRIAPLLLPILKDMKSDIDMLKTNAGIE